MRFPNPYAPSFRVAPPLVRARLPPAITDKLDEHVHHKRKTETHENEENSHCLQRRSLCSPIALRLAWLKGANKPVKNGTDGLKKSPRIYKDFVIAVP